MSVLTVKCPKCSVICEIKEKSGFWRMQCQSCAHSFNVKVKASWKAEVIKE